MNHCKLLGILRYAGKPISEDETDPFRSYRFCKRRCLLISYATRIFECLYLKRHLNTQLSTYNTSNQHIELVGYKDW